MNKTDLLDGEQLSIMTLDEIEAARRDGLLPEGSTVACLIGDHAPKCKGRVISADWRALPCECKCHEKAAL